MLPIRQKNLVKSRRSTVSLCMIVRNEEENLRSCLEFAAGLTEETIVVDTGSVDQTKEVVKAFGANLAEFSWAECRPVASAVWPGSPVKCN
jgi:glycosyltransferase involved in cell wall biosynthesis